MGLFGTVGDCFILRNHICRNEQHSVLAGLGNTSFNSDNSDCGAHRIPASYRHTREWNSPVRGFPFASSCDFGGTPSGPGVDQLDSFAVFFVEPLFQMVFSAEHGLQTVLVFGSVSSFSAFQLWLFKRFGFGAMMVLRLAFYLFWHVIWGTVRLLWLFPPL